LHRKEHLRRLTIGSAIGQQRSRSVLTVLFDAVVGWTMAQRVPGRRCRRGRTHRRRSRTRASR